MGWKIVKFGGSILASERNMRKIVKLVKEYGQNTIYVVSAFNGITNSILKFMSHVENNSYADFAAFCNNFYLYHAKFLEMFKVRDRKPYEEIKDVSNTLKSHLLSNINRRFSDSLKADILHLGEKSSSIAFAYILKYSGMDVKRLSPEEIGLQTVDDREFLNATVDFHYCEKSLFKYFRRNEVFVLPGFYGVTKKGEIALFGRNGSDYTASVVAACLNADFLDIYKNVSGFMTCDPKLIPNSKTIKHLTYEEAAELSHFGAKILHPLAIEPVRRKGIPTRIYNIKNANFVPKTLISSHNLDTEIPVKSVTFTNISIVKLRGRNVEEKFRMLSRITSLLSKHGVNIKSVNASQTSVNIIVSSDDARRCIDLLENEQINWVKSIEYEDGVSLIAIAGEKLLNIPDLVLRASKAIFEAGVNIEMISFGNSKTVGYFVVKRRDARRCLHAIHHEFFDKKLKEAKE